MELHYLSCPLSGAFGPHTWLHRQVSEQQQKNTLNLLKNKYILLWVKFNDRLKALSTMLCFRFSRPCPFVDLIMCESCGCGNPMGGGGGDLSTCLIDGETGLSCSRAQSAPPTPGPCGKPSPRCIGSCPRDLKSCCLSFGSGCCCSSRRKLPPSSPKGCGHADTEGFMTGRNGCEQEGFLSSASGESFGRGSPWMPLELYCE